MARTRPNVLLIMSDQHHPRFMGCAGEPLVQTPNLDQLAHDGARLDQAYCTFPLCGPSRASFLTSRLPSSIDCMFNHSTLSPDLATFAHQFLVGGYDPVLCGRMHMVGFDQYHGFTRRLAPDVPDSVYIHAGWKLQTILGDLVGTPGYSRKSLLQSGPGETGYLAYDRFVTETAVDWLKQRAAEPSDQPFALVVGYVAPHCPFVCPPGDYKLYDDRIGIADLPQPDRNPHPAHRALRQFARLEGPGVELIPLENQRRARVAYYGLCTFLDRCIGQVLRAVEQAGLADDTIVVYTSDHGEMLGEHGLWWKSSFFEGSLGVPLLLRWPGRIAPGQRFSQPVTLMDVGPTLLEMTGCPAIPHAEGQSFAGCLHGPVSAGATRLDPQRPIFAQNIQLWGTEGGLQGMIRLGPWKLCEYSGQSPLLFNLDDDPGETHDLSGDPTHAGRIASMRTLLLQRWPWEDATERARVRQACAGSVAAWVRSVSPPEPLPVWWKQPPENRIVQ